MSRTLSRLSLLAVLVLGLPAAALAQLPFSYVVTPPAGARIMTPMSEIHANTPPGQPRPGHSWWVMASTTGQMTVTLANSSPDGVKATIFNPSNVAIATIAPIFGTFNSLGNEVRGAVTFPATAGAQYRVQVDAVGTFGPAVCACPDYFLELDGAVEAGMATPTAFNMLAVAGPPMGDHGPGGSVNWRLNVGATESLDVTLAPTGNGSTAPNLRVVLIDANDHVRLDERATPPASGALPRTISIPDAGNTPGAWTMAIWGDAGPFPNGPYRILRGAAADRAIYVAWDTEGQGALEVNVVQGASPSTTPYVGPVDVLVTDIGGFAELKTIIGGHVEDDSNSVSLRKLHIQPPAGWTATPADLNLYVTYAAKAIQTIRLQDLTPPTLMIPADMTAMATSASGATVTFDVSATDLDVVTVPAAVNCSNASGSSFPTGVTLVTCTAADAHGNTAIGTFTVTVTSATTTALTSAGASAAGDAATFTATVSAVSGTATGLVTFSEGTTTLGTAAVDSTGHATFTTTALGLGPHTITASYGGSDYFTSSASAPVTHVIFANASASGSFVIGDGNALVGAQVTFWGAQWSKQNSLSGGGAPASFKGFANTATGASWSTDPGNSSNPPSSVASYISVIITSSASKSGSAISGNVTAMAIIRTDAGYAGNPGHAGTGTIVAIIR